MSYRILLVTRDNAFSTLAQSELKRQDSTIVIEQLDRLDSAVNRVQNGSLDIVLLDEALAQDHALTTLELLSRIAARVPLMLYTHIAKTTGGIPPSVSKGFPFSPIRSLRELLTAVSDLGKDLRAQAILDSIGDVIIGTNLHGQIDYLNSAAQRISGWTLEQARGHLLSEVMPAAVMQCKPPSRPDIQLDDIRPVFEDAQTPIHDNDGNLSGSVIVWHDVSLAQATAERMTYLAQHDFLTQLPNRMLLDDRIAQGIEQAKRHAKALALIFVDLDNFKSINDSLGHAVGDRLLQSVADRLQSCVRSSDTVSRTGGDEFIVLLTEMQGEKNACATAQKILKAMALEHDIEHLPLKITCSLGISLYPRDGQNSDALVCHADHAMYQAKQAGRNRYHFFSADEQPQEVPEKKTPDCR